MEPVYTGDTIFLCICPLAAGRYFMIHKSLRMSMTARNDYLRKSGIPST
ncbi:MAG: hypothetical protein Q4C96_05740 [Planctomycetia bacterium]|nr:hypothetical protein [Planctomycetia bacterium]